ncbi:MAG: hypothetical protein LBI53_01420 [Candidatus Peribacteria bacterium]|nr:hypothetical protein [Candidatus Peribacteria bacterium]
MLSKDFTVKKLQQRIRSLKSDVKKLPAISERPRIYEDALKHLDEENNKKHHIIRLVSKEKKEDLEKETKRLTLKVDGELETELKM